MIALCSVLKEEIEVKIFFLFFLGWKEEDCMGLARSRAPAKSHHHIIIA